MKTFIYFFLLGFFCTVFGHANAQTNKITCSELGLSLIIPSEFKYLDSSQYNALSKRGEKAVKETFDKETMTGWQPVCLNMQDSLKRAIMALSITTLEAVAQNGSIDKFIDQVFKDGNDFIVERFRQKLKDEIELKVTKDQSDIVIAGMKVRKNAFSLHQGKQLLMYSRSYFFNKNNKLYLLSFAGSFKATNNEEVVAAIENAKPL